jgi:DNA polymerase
MNIEGRAADLYARVRACTGCPLSRTRTLAVPGEGPLEAELMFIGEAPGVNEDRQGRPFVGQAGQFLGELLAAAGLRRDEVYICNVLKCRPPGNRDPLPGEIEACRDFLDEQIDLIDPLVIVTLGRFSMAKFFPNQSISRIHGHARESGGRFYVPMFHPAAALHQQSLREVMLADFRALPALLERARRSRASAPETPQSIQLGLASGPPIEAGPPAPGEPAPEAAVSGAPATQIRLFD